MLNQLFKSIIDSDPAPVVICDTDSTVMYMNPASIRYYRVDLTGRNVKSCHNADSCEKIDRVLRWFTESVENNKVYTYRGDEQNKDVYMIALRDESGKLIGYYEKHEFRNRETAELYDLK